MNAKQLEIPFPSLSLAAITDSAVALLRQNAGEQPYFGCFSGGKDSVVIKEISRLAGVAVEWHYHVTTIDPPELIWFIREHHSDVRFDAPRGGNFFRQILHKGIAPTRWRRWCCDVYKERPAPRGWRKLLGVRAEESPRRASRWSLVSPKWVCPIWEWRLVDVWEFIEEQRLSVCSLYAEGWDRLGCIGCPMQRGPRRQLEFDRWPRFAQKWRSTLNALWERDHTDETKAVSRFQTADAYWHWWMNH